MTLAYRRDIDGLRALAVVPVVAYHAGLPGVTGGFVGVDVLGPFEVQPRFAGSLVGRQHGRGHEVRAETLDVGRRRIRNLQARARGPFGVHASLFG